MLPEAIRAKNAIEEKYEIKGVIINYRIYDNYYLSEIIAISKSIKNILIVDTANEGLSISHQIFYQISKSSENVDLDILTMPDTPEPTSYFLTKNFYINALDIIEKMENLLKEDLSLAKKEIIPSKHHDVPGEWFKGPF